ncbi:MULTISPECIES: ImuA family protein [unclassified Sphingomonas]|uniref:ImuA family protein n=1 Tax=unclassified Sphingomonas TaxID=196159 RepID=UPI001D100928|nr:protein ImuA [Sphingomonas sp. IC4-52]MCC2981643.1 protein ImuA [Sphingomonas sp. IC4-52]MCD2316629.1 protein ImuA [Sphingomonas sp. IC-11]
MSSPAVIAELRETLRAIEGDGYRRRETLPFGIASIDSRLADGGLRLDALHEVAAGTANLGDDAAATLFMAGIAARAWGPILWVVRRRDLFAPGLYQAGLSPERVLYAEARDDAELLALMEEGLRHRGLGAVIGEVKRAAMPATRRLQLAAEGGRTIALLLRRHPREDADPLAPPSAALTRWRIASAPSVPLRCGSMGRPRWAVSLVRQRGGEPFDTLLEACDDTGRLALPAALGDRSRASGRASPRTNAAA